jgi:hypothetical protein
MRSRMPRRGHNVYWLRQDKNCRRISQWGSACAARTRRSSGATSVSDCQTITAITCSSGMTAACKITTRPSNTSLGLARSRTMRAYGGSWTPTASASHLALASSLTMSTEICSQSRCAPMISAQCRSGTMSGRQTKVSRQPRAGRRFGKTPSADDDRRCIG